MKLRIMHETSVSGAGVDRMEGVLTSESDIKATKKYESLDAIFYWYHIVHITAYSLYMHILPTVNTHRQKAKSTKKKMAFENFV